jgi:5-formyltetrahydrofolate cyclo-ligase
VNSAELKKAKKRIRRQVLAARDGIPPAERLQLAHRVAERFLSLPEVEGARAVMAFWSFGSELPTMPLIESLLARGVVVALPRIVDGDLQPRTWRPGEATIQTRFGALEPVGGEVLAPHDIDVVATPAVAFDRSGRRVGYGGGYYDRFFPATRTDALRAGIGFGVQLLEGDLPGGTFDLRVDVVVTEEEAVRCPRDP